MRKNFLRISLVLLCTMFGFGNLLAAGTMVGDFVRYTTLDPDLSGTYLMTWSYDAKPHSVYDAAKKYFNPAANAPELFSKQISAPELPDTLKDVDLNFAVKIAKATTPGTYSIQLPDGNYLGFDDDLGLITSATPLELYMSYVDDATKMKTGWLISDENDFDFDASSAPATWLLASRPGQYTYVVGVQGGWNSPMYGVPHFYKMVSSKKIPEYADFERCTKNMKNWEGQYAVVFNYDGKPHSSISENHQFVADPAAVKVYESGQNIINVDVDLSVTVAKGVAEGAYTIQLPNGKYFTFDDDLGLVESETAGDVYIKYINIPSFREGIMISDEPKFVTSYEDEDPGNYVVYFYRQSSVNYKAYRNKQAAQQYQMPLLFKKIEPAPIKNADFEFITEDLSNWEGSWLMCWSFNGKPHTDYEEGKKAFVPAPDAPQLFYPNIATDEMPKTLTGISMKYAVKIAKAATEGSYSMQLPDGKYLGFDDDLGLVTSATPLELYMSYVDDPTRYKTGTLISDENDFNFTSSSSPATWLLASMPGQVTLVKGINGNWHSPAHAVARMYRAIEIPATGIALDKKSATLKLGETLNLTATLTPANTTTTDIIWKSTADTVASVDEGMVTPISYGETKIIVATADGKFADTCVVTVKNGAVATLADVLKGKTILRVLNDNSGVYALAVDAADAPTLVKADFEGNVVTTYATDFCSHKGTAAGTRDLADIALTADGVLLGINAEHNTTTRTEGRATLLYKWNADGTGEIFQDFDKLIGSANNPVAGNFANATTDMLAFNGTLADGVLALRAMTQGSGNRSRIGLFKFVDGAITLKNTAKDLASWSATSGIYMTNALTAGNFVWSATGVATIEFSSAVALTATEPEAIAATATMALSFIAIKGYSFATIDGKKVMMIPSATDVKLYNVTSGLNQAATMETLNATQTVESPMYMYAGFAGDKVVLVRDGVVETIAYGAPVTGMDEVVANSEIQKIVINGTLYIIRGGVMYNLQGQMME